jgi:hypothetical protein
MAADRTPLAVEHGCAKSWDVHGDEHRAWRARIRPIIRQHYPEPLPILWMLDEPMASLVKGRYFTRQTVFTTGDHLPDYRAVATVIRNFERECRDQGDGVGLIETLPNHDAWQALTVVQHLYDLGGRLDRVTWDALFEASVDITSKGWVDAITRDTKSIAQLVPEIGVITQPVGEIHTQEEFADGMRRCHRHWHRHFAGLCDVETVQSWHSPSGIDGARILREMPTFRPLTPADLTDAAWPHLHLRDTSMLEPQAALGAVFQEIKE